MATMTITIKGIAIIYNQGQYWKALFPFGGGHTVRISEAQGPATPLGFPNNTVDVTRIVNATYATVPPGREDHFHDYLDITDKNCSHETIRLLPTWANNAVLLSVGNAQFCSADMTKSHYLLRDDTTAKAITRQPAIIGSTAKLTVSGDSIKITTKDSSNNDVFRDPFITDVEIVIDNTCPQNCSHTSGDADFEMIYSVIEDARHPCRYKLEREAGDGPSFWRRLIDKLTGSGSMVVFDNNPDPGYEGLPCNVVVASDPSGLP